MNEKERLHKTLRGETVDRVPCICPGGMMNMIVEDVMDLTGAPWPDAHVDAEMMAKLSYGIYEHGGFENLGAPFCMTVEAEAMGAPTALGTKINEPRVTDYVIESAGECEKLSNIDVTKGRAKVVIDAIGLLSERHPNLPVIANLTGPISLASSLLDANVFYKEMYRNPAAIHSLLSLVTDNLIVFGRAQLLAGATVLAISDPSGTGEILGAKNFRTFVIPYLNRIIDELKPLASGGTIIHICGRLKKIYPELVELHSDAISFDSITSAAQVKAHVTNKVIMGNASTFTIENGTFLDIEKTAKNCIRNSVDILAPACGIGAKTRLANIQMLVNAAKEQPSNV